MVKLSDRATKVPWGIFFGVCGIIAFYTLVGAVASHIIFNSIAEQTHETVAFFSKWWHVLLFVACLITTLTGIASLVMYILRESQINGAKRREKAERKRAKRASKYGVDVNSAVAAATVEIRQALSDIDARLVLLETKYAEAEAAKEERIRKQRETAARHAIDVEKKPSTKQEISSIKQTLEQIKKTVGME